MGRGRYSPWDDLVSRGDVIFDVVDFDPDQGDALLWPLEDGRMVIAVGRHLDAAGRRCAVAHELVHLDRGGSGARGGQSAALSVGVLREERRVDRIVAGRLVPQGELAELIRVLDDLGQGVTALDVAEHFGVTEGVATVAMTELARDGFGERWAG